MRRTILIGLLAAMGAMMMCQLQARAQACGNQADLRQSMLGTWLNKKDGVLECQVMTFKSNNTFVIALTACANGNQGGSSSGKWSVSKSCQVVMTGGPFASPQTITPTFSDKDHFTITQAPNAVYYRQ
jgi:hypothetical protein